MYIVHVCTGVSYFWMHTGQKVGEPLQAYISASIKQPLWVPIRCEQDPHSMRNMPGVAINIWFDRSKHTKTFAK